MLKKRGQLTIFIILGIILLLSVALFLFLRQEVSVFKPETVVPPEIVPINQYILDCVDSIARDGANTIGANGGYIDFPIEIETDAESYVPSIPISPVKTALWFYRGQIRVPPLNYITAELEDYIDENLPACLQGFESFRTTFNITELGDISVKVELSEESFDVDVNYPLDIILKAREQKFFLEDFSVTVPYRIKKMYEFATKIMQEELATRFLETKTIDIIALDPAIPYTGSEFSCMPKTWEMKDIEDRLKLLLSVTFPQITVERTSYEPIPRSRPYMQNHYVWDLTEEKYPDTHASFSYDTLWPFELFIRPNSGKTLRSNANRGQDLLSFICIQIWHFTYDVRYPVLVTLKDDATRTHEDYVFNFAFDVSINHNMPDKSNFASSTFSFDTAGKEDEFCREVQTNRLTVYTFENVSTEEAGDLTTEIDRVNITYTCIRLKCPVGQSEWQFRGAVSYISEEMPVCINGVLRGEKEGYEPAEMFVSTNTEKSVDLYLTPYIEVPVTIFKQPEASTDKITSFTEDDSALITVERKDFKSDAVYSQEAQGDLKLLAKWNHAYNLTIFLSDGDTIRVGYKATWTPDWEKLKDAKEIRFYVLERPYTEDVTKLAQILEGMDQLVLEYNIIAPQIIT